MGLHAAAGLSGSDVGPLLILVLCRIPCRAMPRVGMRCSAWAALPQACVSLLDSPPWGQPRRCGALAKKQWAASRCEVLLVPRPGFVLGSLLPPRLDLHGGAEGTVRG